MEERLDINVNLGGQNAGNSRAVEDMRALARAARELEEIERRRDEAAQRRARDAGARNRATFGAWDRADANDAERQAIEKSKVYDEQVKEHRKRIEDENEKRKQADKELNQSRMSDIHQMAAGYLPGRLGKAQMFAGTVASTVAGGMHSYGAALASKNDPTLLGGESARGQLEQIPVFGTFMRGLHALADGINGVTAKLRLSAEQHAMAMQNIASGARAQSSYYGTRSELAGYRGKRLARGDRSALAGFSGDVLDPMQVAHYERTTDIALRTRSLDAELGGITAQQEEGAHQEKMLRHQADIAGRVAKKYVARADSERGASTWWDPRKAEVTDAERRAMQALNQERQATEQLEHRILQNKDLEIQKERTLHELAKQRVEHLKEQARVLGEQASMQRSLQSSMGRALPGERALAINYAKQAKAKGFASLTPAQRDTIARVGGARGAYFVERGLEEIGEKDPRSQELSKLLGGSGETAAELMKKQLKLQQDINVQVEFDEEHLVKAIERSMEKFVKSLDKVVTRIGEIQAAELRRQQMEQRANNR